MYSFWRAGENASKKKSSFEIKQNPLPLFSRGCLFIKSPYHFGFSRIWNRTPPRLFLAFSECDQEFYLCIHLLSLFPCKVGFDYEFLYFSKDVWAAYILTLIYIFLSKYLGILPSEYIRVTIYTVRKCSSLWS